MDIATAIALLLANLNKLAEFGAVIVKARNEGRDVSAAEVAASGLLAQAKLDELGAKIADAGG